MTDLKKKLCGPEFVINGKNVYVDQILIWFNEFPVFFVCVDDDGGYYLAMMLGQDDDTYGYTYYIVESFVDEIQKMMLKQLPMRDVFLLKDHFWKVVSGVTVTEDVVDDLPITEIDRDLLPAPDKYFEASSFDDKNYIRKLAKMLKKTTNK